MASRAEAIIPLRPRRSLSIEELTAREHKGRRRRLWGWIFLLLIVAAAGVLAFVLGRPRPVPLEARYRMQAVTRGDLRREVRATGHVEAVSTVSVGAEISGRIEQVLVDYNSRVRVGQLLARFDRKALSAQRGQARAQVAAARAQLAQAQFDEQQALRNLSRSEGLFLRKAESEQEHDAAVTTARLATARLHAAEAQLEAQSASQAVMDTNLDHAEIRSPIDGIVITRNIDPGQTVASVLQSPVLFTVAAKLEAMRVIAAVDEADIGEVVVGQRASCTVSGYPDRTFDGLVTEVRNSPVVVQDVVTYGVVVDVANPDLALRPGMTATVHVEVGAVADALRVPSGALRFTPPGQVTAKEPTVWILAQGEPRAVRVKAGLSDGELTAVEPLSPLPPGAQALVDLTPAGRKAYAVANTLERRP